KSAITGSRPDLRVPVRDVALTNGEVVSLYDTSGPYTDAAIGIDVRRGLPDVRGAWIGERGDTAVYDGRLRRALDDGAKHEDDLSRQESERIERLRAEAAGLQRTPRRAKSGAGHTG